MHNITKSIIWISFLLGINSAKSYANEIDSTILKLDNITVTAIKQQSNLSLLPMSATVVQEKTIERLNISSIRGVSEISPNLYIPDYGSPITSSIYMRGIGARLDQAAVGLNIDNVSIANRNAYDFNITDIKKIEVLRGAQSSLYGRNTLAGQINIYTLSPFEYQGSRVMGQMSNGPGAKMALSHYAKFNDHLAMSWTGNFNYTDGFYRNAYNNLKIGGQKGGGLRWRTQWRPNLKLSFDNVASFGYIQQSGYPYAKDDENIINYNDTCFYRRNVVSDALTIKYTSHGFSLASITSFQNVTDNMTLDQDFTPLRVFTMSQATHDYSISQDLVARGTSNNYSWIAGTFGFYRHNSMHVPVRLEEDGIRDYITGQTNDKPYIPIYLKWNDKSILLDSKFTVPGWGAALYHQSCYKINKLNFTAGVRMDLEHVVLKYINACNTGFEAFMKPVTDSSRPIQSSIVNMIMHGKLHKSFTEILPKFAISYDLSSSSTESNIYVSWGKGYKSGGYNTQIFSDILQQALKQQVLQEAMTLQSRYNPTDDTSGDNTTPTSKEIENKVLYKPEYSWNYEIGAHLSQVYSSIGRLTGDISLFYMDVKNQQITTFPTGNNSGRITTNAGRTRSFGLEAQIKWCINRHFNADMSYGFTNARFRRYISGNNDYRHKVVPYAPAHTLFISGVYSLDVTSDWALSIGANARGLGRIYWNEENSLKQPFYAQLGLSVTADRRWISLEAWMENVTGCKYNVFYFRSLEQDFVQKGKPRQFGITLRMKFDTPRK